MSFLEAVKTVLFKKYATFSGRAPRSEFWWFMLFMSGFNLFFSFIIGFIVNFLYFNTEALSSSITTDEIMKVSIMGQMPAFVLSVLLLLPNMAVTVRRLHDMNLSGWWLFPYCAFVIWEMVIIIFAFFSLEFYKNFSNVMRDSASLHGFVWFVFLIIACFKGTQGTNKFGADPLRPDENVFA